VASVVQAQTIDASCQIAPADVANRPLNPERSPKMNLVLLVRTLDGAYRTVLATM
jgi:hypothetical protein